MAYEEWPGVDEALAALNNEFGLAYVEHTGGGCYSIFVPVESMGVIAIGDKEGPLGESCNRGWSAEVIDLSGDTDFEPVCTIPDRNVPKLVQALRAFIRDGTRTTLTWRQELCWRRDRHYSATGHFATPDAVEKSDCAECHQFYREFQEGEMTE